MDIGERLKEARKKSGLTQKQLAERLNVTYVNIAQWENGRRNPKIETLRRIAAALNMSLPELIDSPPARTSTPESRAAFEEKASLEPGALDKMSARRDWPIDQQRLVNAFDKLNDKGREKAIERTEELAEHPRYRKE